MLFRASGLLKKDTVWAKMFTLLLGKRLPGVTYSGFHLSEKT